MNQSELDEILESHNRWIRGEKDGRRAGLWGVDLRGADLSGAGLRGANLRGAILCKSCLDGANLTGADLHAVNLNNVNLSSVNGIVRLSENELLVKGTNIIYTYDGTIWQEPYILTNYYLTRSRRSF